MSQKPEAALATRLAWLGTVSALAFLAMVPLSFGLAAFAPVLVVQPEEIAFIDRLADQIRWLPGAYDFLRAAIRGETLADPVWRVVAATLPLAVASIAMLLVLRRIQADPAAHNDGPADRIAVAVAVSLALCAVFAFPTYTPDFFLSIAWGRMFADGQNPYYASLTPEIFGTLPGSRFEEGDRFTYGPLWAVLTGGLGRLSGRREWLEFFLHKAVLLVAWLGTLFALRRMAGRRGLRDRLLVTCLVGWLPAAVYLAIAEGHNDILMVFFVSLWLEAVDRKDHRLAPLWLACSCLVKFITLPLIGLELLAARRAGVIFTRRYILTMAACGIASLLALFVFYEGPGFLQATRRMQNWVFWVPSYYAVNVAALAGLQLPIVLVDRLVTVLGITSAGAVLWHGIRKPSWESWLTSGLAVMACVLLTLVGHVWPWFALWLVPFLAVLWPARVAGVLLTFLLMVPFLDLGWILAPDWRYRPVVDMPVYTSVLLVIAFLWLRGPGAMGNADRQPIP